MDVHSFSLIQRVDAAAMGIREGEQQPSLMSVLAVQS